MDIRSVADLAPSHGSRWWEAAFLSTVTKEDSDMHDRGRRTVEAAAPHQYPDR
jgi:hypothetical protein